MKNILLIFLIFLFSCSKKSDENQVTVTDKNSFEKSEENKLKKKLEIIEIDSLWKIVINKNGCLTGGQNVENGEFGSEGCIMTNTMEWKVFLEKPKNELTEFLVSKLDKKDTTKVHTCPFFLATEGELANYALQGVHKKNWFDFAEFKIYKDKVQNPNNKMLSNRDNFQGYLNNNVLNVSTEREKLKKLWLKELNK